MPIPEPGPSTASTPSSSSSPGAEESRSVSGASTNTSSAESPASRVNPLQTMSQGGSRAYSLEDLGLFLRGLDLRTPQSSVDAPRVDYPQDMASHTYDEENALQAEITDADDAWLVQDEDPQHDMLMIRVDIVMAHLRNMLLAIVDGQRSRHKQALHKSAKRLEEQTRIQLFVENKLRETMHSKFELQMELDEAIKKKDKLQERLNTCEQKTEYLQVQLAQANATNQQTLDQLLARLHATQKQVTRLQAEREELLRVLELCNAKNEINERDRRWRGQAALH
ncbi:hypothetical protein BO86DRAFT_401322 [Aspergillus japonicus CBS 114.51]|uniref:Uncharacterized protein n=1 Tax=Aspergillus japonicus CBS 114.51 TaxID=1448312 RepID=A0A8T8WW22_ASPJA|nr:hypothetical protein BO86DRAFT_401322 [Aspergillus japonicus CBS 114.51]RAH80036.1 hypothetical protein BO86DRAFT_401322 [Aspergillus japonicus CBS 114.51]